MKELTAGTRTCLDPQGRQRTFHYFITVDPAGPETARWEEYGVGIWEEGGERAEVRRITPLQRRVEQLTELLLRNAATPVNLPEVVEDWL